MCKCTRSAKIALLTLTSVAMLLAAAISFLGEGLTDLAQQIGIFRKYNSSLEWRERNSPSNITITPAGWAFSMWGIIYIYQFVLLIYCWTLVFRRAYAEGPYLCVQPDFLPSCFLLWHFCSSLCNMGWIFVDDRVDYDQPLVVLLASLLLGITICLYFAVVSSYLGLYREKERVLSSGMRADYWLVVGLVQNGVSLYATWVTVASFINIDIALVYFARVNETTASIGCLGSIMAIAFIYAIADLTVIDFATRFVFTPHLVVMWACAGSLARNFVAWSTTSIMTIVLVCVVAAALIVKLLLILIRSRRRPILRDGSYKLES